MHKKFVKCIQYAFHFLMHLCSQYFNSVERYWSCYFVGTGSPGSILLKYCKSLHFEQRSVSSAGQIRVKGFQEGQNQTRSPGSIFLKYCKSLHFEEQSTSNVGQIGVKGFQEGQNPLYFGNFLRSTHSLQTMVL